MNIDQILVRVGMNMEEATILTWRKQPGESFVTGDTIYDIETDKVTFEVEALFDGKLIEIKVPEGENAAVGQVVGIAEQS